ncbi:polysaccharide pyruvyl transferase family protein [Pseudomonas frederiksbergensis]|jgi:hypothetical protein|uniref:polysaccharide pyruvyl transferase family protein n=1 Tax=Pseudomonas frederiksbergensis TaxID=104087 RepID=UPI0006973969|nr:polysaccharide pyruvyl transferase family protein [Pseudomonas frederiksbergensis]WRV68969.1 polysaccharide pyruvyl transferase family protein [Pseudomonas frederiksbergensis]
MDIFTIEYSGTSFESWANLGDDIQSLAAQKLLPYVSGGVSREELTCTKKTGVLSMNGYFLGGCEWPPAPAIEPFFFAFHVTPGSQAKICSPAGVEYLKQFQPIGCRDRGTMELMQAHGLEAFYSKCVTLTLPRRATAPVNGKVFMVGLSKGGISAVPRAIRKKAVLVDQAKLRLPSLSPKAKEMISQELLDTYAREASLVITSKIHCAMPCIAMGIPVVFLYDEKCKDDYRVGIIADLVGINYIGESWFAKVLGNRLRSRRIDWAPVSKDIEAEKSAIRAGYLEAFERAAQRYQARNKVAA